MRVHMMPAASVDDEFADAQQGALGHIRVKSPGEATRATTGMGS